MSKVMHALLVEVEDGNYVLTQTFQSLDALTDFCMNNKLEGRFCYLSVSDGDIRGVVDSAGIQFEPRVNLEQSRFLNKEGQHATTEEKQSRPRQATGQSLAPMGSGHGSVSEPARDSGKDGEVREEFSGTFGSPANSSGTSTAGFLSELGKDLQD